MLYTRKINPIFSDFQNRIFDFDIAALDMTNLEWSDIFPRSRISLLLVMPFICLGDIVETRVIRETTLEGHISNSRRGITIPRIGLELPWSQLNLGSIKHLCCVYTLGVARDKGQVGRKWFITLGPCNRIFYCDFRVHGMRVGVAEQLFFGFPRIFNVKLCPWRGMAYHGRRHFLRVCVICMVFASICSRPCYISSCGRRDGEPHVTRALPMSQLWNSKR